VSFGRGRRGAAPFGKHPLGRADTGVGGSILEPARAVEAPEVTGTVTAVVPEAAVMTVAAEVREPGAETDDRAQGQNDDPKSASHGVLLSAAVAVAVAPVTEAVKALLDEVAQNFPLPFIERFVDLASRADARAPDRLQRGVVPAEHLGEARFVDPVASEDVGHGPSRVAHVTPRFARLSDELVDRGRDDFLLTGRGVESREDGVEGSALPEATPVPVVKIAVVAAVAAARDDPRETDQAERSENETEHRAFLLREGRRGLSRKNLGAACEARAGTIVKEC
jgi:hypothetical protein